MLTIGLCGGSGTGKTTAQTAFAEAGVPGLDTDVLYHELIAGDTPLSRKMIEIFGECIRLENGGIDRRRLAGLVFGDAASAERRAILNKITHEAVLAECRIFLSKMKEAGVYAALINAPLLFESGFAEECDITVAITAPRSMRIERIMVRDGITRHAAEQRIDAQLDDAFLVANTDYRIHNDGSEADLRQAVANLITQIKSTEE